MSDWIVNDCGSYIQMTRSTCGTTTESSRIQKTDFVASIFRQSQDAYVLNGRVVLSVKGLPSSVKDELDRIYLSSHLEDTATELNRKLTRAEDSRRKRAAYGVLVFVISFLAFVVASYVRPSLPTPLPGLIFFMPLLIGVLLRNRFVRKYAPYDIWTDERLFLHLWNATDALQRYVNSDGTDDGSFSDAYRFLDVSSYVSSTETSWAFVHAIKTQTFRVLRNVMRRIRPYIMNERRNVRQIEQLVIPTLKRLLPLLIN